MMTKSVPMIGAAALAMLVGCAPNPEAERKAQLRTEKELAEALAGYTAGKPVDCISNFRSVGMQIIDDGTLLYRDGKTIYLQRTIGRCSGIASGSTTLVTKQYGTTQLCRGDINETIDLRTGIRGGSCVFGDFVPYTKP